jgi:hypothetical protein
MDQNLSSLLQDAALRLPERLWESPTRFWSILAFSGDWPNWSGREAEFAADLPSGGGVHGTVSLSRQASWIRFRDLPDDVQPVYVVIGQGVGPKSGCLRYEDLTRHFGDLQLIDLVFETPSEYQILPTHRSGSRRMVDSGMCWMLEMEQSARSAIRSTGSSGSRREALLQ